MIIKQQRIFNIILKKKPNLKKKLKKVKGKILIILKQELNNRIIIKILDKIAINIRRINQIILKITRGIKINDKDIDDFIETVKDIFKLKKIAKF